MDYEDLIRPLKQEFMLRRWDIVVLTANLKSSADEISDYYLWRPEETGHLHFLIKDLLKLRNQSCNETPIAWPRRHNNIAHYVQINVVNV